MADSLLLIVEVAGFSIAIALIAVHLREVRLLRNEEESRQRLLEQMSTTMGRMAEVTRLLSRREYLNSVLQAFERARANLSSCVIFFRYSEDDQSFLEKIPEVIGNATRKGVRVRYLVPLTPPEEEFGFARISMGYKNQLAGASVRYHPDLEDFRYTIADGRLITVGSPEAPDNLTREGFTIESEGMGKLILNGHFERKWREAVRYPDYLRAILEDARRHHPSGWLNFVSRKLEIPTDEIRRVSEMKWIKGLVLLDMDDTVLDTGRIYLQVRDELAARLVSLGVSQSAESEKQEFWTFYGETYLNARREGKHLRLHEVIREYARKKGLSQDQTEELARLGEKPYTEPIPLRPYAEDTIRRLRANGCAVYLFSEGDLGKIGQHRKMFDDCFSVSPKTKENMGRVLDQLLSMYCIKNSRVIVVGDDPATDINIGNQLSATTVLIAGSAFLTEKVSNILADYTGEDLRIVLEATNSH